MTAVVVFVTPNQGRQDEVLRLLGGLEVELSRLGPAVPEGLELEASARVRASSAYRTLGRRCFVENTAFELDGRALRGAELKARLAELSDDGFCAAHAGQRVVARVVVALAEASVDDSEPTLRTFTGELVGHVAPAPRGDGGVGWDRCVVPEGYERTLAELGASKYLVNMRHAPYLDLADHLRGRRYGGAFEAHVTVRLGAGEVEFFRAACDQLGVKCVLIELPAGEQVHQPMTASVHRGDLRQVQDEVHTLARELVVRGFDVVRVKIEALPRNLDIPETDDEARLQSPANYFEYHVKLALPGGEDRAEALARVRQVCLAHEAHLSRNANARGAGGLEERFVTLRVARSGRVRAEARFDALCADLAALGYAMRGRIREYTVHDSNYALDRGWA